MLLRVIVAIILIFITSSQAKDDIEELLVIPSSETSLSVSLFSLNCHLNSDVLNCTLTPNENIYLYKNSIAVTSKKAQITDVSLPKGVMHQSSLATDEVYDAPFEVNVDIAYAKAGNSISFKASGCDINGICYPEFSRIFVLDKDIKNAKITVAPKTEHTIFSVNDSIFTAVLLCIIFGAALNLTPCVLPLLSIYSATILGNSSKSIKDNLKLNSGYILGLAFTYCLIGLLFAVVGVKIHGFLQHPVVTVCLGILLLIFALNCLDAFSLKLPQTLNNMLQQKLGRLENGTFKKSVFFGCCSALFTTPCTSAPLAGALIYVINSNSYTKGAVLFFAIGLGMGIPLLLIGLFGGRVLNTFRSKTQIIKKLFALPLVAGAYMVVRHLTYHYTFAADLAVLALLSGLAVYICVPAKSLLKKGLMSFVTAFVIVLAGFNFYKVQNTDTPSPFKELSSVEQINDFKGQKILVTVSASWCSNCHDLDNTVYKSKEFAKMSQNYALVRFDFSEPSSELGEDLIEKFNLMGVPFLAVINEDGTIVSRKTGLVSLEELEALLK